MATVNSVHGIILLPYNTTVAGFNTNHNGWGNNTPDASTWSAWEAAGAVFLPAAGDRDGTYVNGVGYYGDYWSSTALGDDYGAWYVYFDEDDVGPDDVSYRYFGQSVRLVCG